jgi:predicted ester cyclase
MSIADVRVSYPDCHLAFEDAIVQADKEAWRGSFRGTQTGPSPLSGAAPTGKLVTILWCSMSRLEGGKIVEQWVYRDHLGMMQQFGYVLTKKEAEK